MIAYDHDAYRADKWIARLSLRTNPQAVVLDDVASIGRRPTSRPTRTSEAQARPLVRVDSKDYLGRWAAMGRSGRLAVSVVRINGRTCEENVAEIIWGITVFTTTDTEGHLARVTRLRYSFL